MAKEFNDTVNRGTDLGLSPEEIAFYDALASNQAAVRELSGEVLRAIARELTEHLQSSVSVDWNVRDTVRARSSQQRRYFADVR